MKPNVKEILKNKTDKMVDLIIDDIGTNGEKTLSASYFDNHGTDTKYFVQVAIKSGAQDTLTDFEDANLLKAKINSLEEFFSDKISSIEEKIRILEEKGEYDDTEIKERISILEQNAMQYSQLASRVEALENHSEESP